jgi:hypothetical protein
MPMKDAPGGGGKYMIVDKNNFPIITSLAAMIVEVKPGAMRELHWHPTVSLYLSRWNCWKQTSNMILTLFRESSGCTLNPVTRVLRYGSVAEMPELLILRLVILLYFLTTQVCQQPIFLPCYIRHFFSRECYICFCAFAICSRPLNSTSGHYVENTHPTETLRYLEIFQSDKVVDFGLEQWLALTPPDLVAQILNVSVETVKSFRSERGILVKGKN